MLVRQINRVSTIVLIILSVGAMLTVVSGYPSTGSAPRRRLSAGATVRLCWGATTCAGAVHLAESPLLTHEPPFGAGERALPVLRRCGLLVIRE